MPKKPKKFYKKAKPQTVEDVEKKIIPKKSKKQEIIVDLIQTTTSEKITVVTQQEYPKNNRLIAEKVVVTTVSAGSVEAKKSARFPWIIMYVVLLLTGVVSLAGIFLVGKQVKEYYQRLQAIETQRQNLQVKYQQIEEMAILHPGSPDVYLQLANISYQLNEKRKAQAFVERALMLDPNDTLAIQLKRIMLE